MRTAALTTLVVLVVVAWVILELSRTRDARAAYLESGREYLARTLDAVGEVPDELVESSGVAVSRSQPGVLWSHNDSGDGPTLYAMDESGRLLATIHIAGVTSLDWEDVAEGPCPVALRGDAAADSAPRCLFIGDIGDNNRVRDSVSVHVLPEPVRAIDGAWPRRVAASSFRVRYPDGPDDSEALAVTPDGDVLVVSKGRSGSIDIFTIPAEQVHEALRSQSTIMAGRTLRTSIAPNAGIGRLVTGAAASPDGRTLAARTYNEVYFFRRMDESGAWSEVERRCVLGDGEPLGEAIDFLDDETMILTSERFRGLPGYIHRVKC